MDAINKFNTDKEYFHILGPGGYKRDVDKLAKMEANLEYSGVIS